jgi:hypothetical protein
MRKLDSTKHTIVANVVVGVLTAVATLGAAYIGKSDFNPQHDNAIAQSDSCAALFDSHSYDQVQATLATFNRNDTVSYAQCRFSYDPTVPRLSCTADQVFNDRKSGSQPFDSTQKDSLGIALDKQGQKVKIVVTLKSWGSTNSTVWPVCKGRFLLGSSVSGEDVYVLHLTRN